MRDPARHRAGRGEKSKFSACAAVNWAHGWTMSPVWWLCSPNAPKTSGWMLPDWNCVRRALAK